MYLGIDLGTSGVKAVLVDGDQNVIAQATAPLTVSRPRPLWSEQDPESWWQATNSAVIELRRSHPGEMAEVAGIGLSGQMHGATLLDGRDRVLRPAILWNDGRSGAECAELARRVPDLPRIAGNLAMPGFTAPKLLWVAEHEPEVFGQVAKVLLPKDYIRLRMTGRYASDMSDSAGTLWLDVAGRRWSPELLDATGLDEDEMPELFEGTEPTGLLLPEVASSWGLGDSVEVAGGAGDNAAGAAGVGVLKPGSAFLSLGTSGVLFVANAGFAPNPDRGVHAFCHCFPGLWHQMSVILSAASCLTWVTRLTGASSEGQLLAEVEAAKRGDRFAAVPAVPVGRAYAPQRPSREGRLLRPDPRAYQGGPWPRGAGRSGVRLRRRAGRPGRSRDGDHERFGDRRRCAQPLVGEHPGRRAGPAAHLPCRRRCRPGVRRRPAGPAGGDGRGPGGGLHSPRQRLRDRTRLGGD